MNQKISQKQIQENIHFFTELEAIALGRLKYYQQKEIDAKGASNEILRKWMNLSNRTYAIFRRDISDYIRHSANDDTLDIEQYSTMAGMRMIRVFLDIVNAFEYISELLRMNSKKLNGQLKDDNVPLTESLKTEWACSDDDMKKDFMSFVHSNVKSQFSKRRAFLGLNLISEDESDFLQFTWDMRNSMHMNFNATKAIKYSLKDPDSGEVYPFDYEKGAGLGIEAHPKWIIVITERIIEIMSKVISSLDDLPIGKPIKDI